MLQFVAPLPNTITDTDSVTVTNNSDRNYEHTDNLGQNIEPCVAPSSSEIIQEPTEVSNDVRPEDVVSETQVNEEGWLRRSSRPRNSVKRYGYDTYV